MWIAEFSESSNLWTQIALIGYPVSMFVWVSFTILRTLVRCESSGPFDLDLSFQVPEPGVLRSFSGALQRLNLLLSFLKPLKRDSQGVPSVLFTCMLSHEFSYERAAHVFDFWPQIKQDYPLNLSILISGGKETNKDSLSNGEWSGKSSIMNPSGIVV